MRRPPAAPIREILCQEILNLMVRWDAEDPHDPLWSLAERDDWSAEFLAAGLAESREIRAEILAAVLADMRVAISDA